MAHGIVGGAVTIASGGTFVANLNGNATNDQILAAGAITITGATLTPNLDYTSTVGDVWTILSAIGGITGTFSGLPDGTQISLIGGGDFYGSKTTNANARLSILDNGAAYFQTMAPSIGSLSGSGYVYLTNNCVLTLGADNTSTVYAGIIQPQSGTGAAITKTGTGTFTFKGMNGCSGVTTVNGGTFGADGYLAGGVTVNSSGTVTGSGSIGALTVNSGGTVQPGTTTIAKTLTQHGMFLRITLFMLRERKQTGTSKLLAFFALIIHSIQTMF